jgi:signal peptidase I
VARGHTAIRRVRQVGSAFGTVLLALLAAATITTATGWLHITPVLSGSMRPNFNPGDAMLTERVAASSLRVGDIVNVKVPAQEGGGQRVHRIVSLAHQGTAVVIHTKGDANNALDPEALTLTGHQFRTIARLPYLGWVVNFRAANGALLLLAAIALAAAISLLQTAWQRNRSLYRRGRHHRPGTSKALAS